MTTRRDVMYREYMAFHEEHPEVWIMFCHFTFSRIRLGYEHYSVYSIFERIRWETDMGSDSEEFKLNNNHRPFYARAFMETYPEYDGFFRTRHQKSEDY